MNDFYITLLSNGSMGIYPQNKTSSFTVHIPRQMNLTGEWDVALAEIHYPYTFFTVQEGENQFGIKSFTATKEFIDSKKQVLPPSTWSTLKITPGFYNDIKEIVNAVNGRVREKTKLSSFFQIDDKSKRLGVKTNEVAEGGGVITYYRAKGRLALQLGCRPDDEVSVSAKPPHVTNIASGVPDTMLVYCDILEPQITGDSWSRLLRTLNTTRDAAEYFGKPCSTEFAHLQYIPVQRKNFESIRIDIRDVSGKLMPFQYGTLTVKLHFKRRRN